MAFIIGKCQLFIPEMCIGVLTTFIQACSLNRKRKAHKITCLYPLEIPDLKSPDSFGIPIVSTPPPPCLRNSSSKNPPLPSEFQKAVRRTVRIFSGIAHSRFSHVSPMIKQLGWVTLEQRRLLSQLNLFYKIQQGLVGISLHPEVCPLDRTYRLPNVSPYRHIQSNCDIYINIHSIQDRS